MQMSAGFVISPTKLLLVEAEDVQSSLLIKIMHTIYTSRKSSSISVEEDI